MLLGLISPGPLETSNFIELCIEPRGAGGPGAPRGSQQGLRQSFVSDTQTAKTRRSDDAKLKCTTNKYNAKLCETDPLIVFKRRSWVRALALACGFAMLFGLKSRAKWFSQTHVRRKIGLEIYHQSHA